MARDLLRKLSLVSLLTFGSVFAGCAMEPTDDVVADDGEGATTDDVTAGNAQTQVKRQSIGNCWIYATASWIEAQHKAATGKEINVSESYFTYWHWFDQLANGSTSTEIATGGSYYVAAEIIARYGLAFEGTFIPEEASAEMSSRQSTALAAINTSLKTGVLKDPVARRNRETVRAELDKAWGLGPEVVKALDSTFGKGVTRTLDRSTARKPAGGLLRAKDIEVRLRDVKAGTWKKGTLQDAIGTRAGWSGRTGASAWQEIDYPTSNKARRDFWKRVQRALHDGQPVIVSWFVDFNALSSKSTFTVEELARRGGAGRQGGHMTVMQDYQINKVPGFGTLAAGTTETRPEALAAALSDDAEIEFVRIKNSWGAFRPDRWADASLPGYHDLYATYLNGPVKKCAEKGGTADRTSCYDHTPLWDVVLPAGY
ncbi:MAG: hypothetical protein JNL79_17815 [Myxococcales bacterium]|nr:hypothetical protein [Myxococcales bacterium]